MRIKLEFRVDHLDLEFNRFGTGDVSCASCKEFHDIVRIP